MEETTEEIVLTPKPKPWWQSKTIWLNVISGLLEGAQLFIGVQFIPPGILTLVTNVLNIVLRKMTSQPIG
jgi:hypothetical protein